MTKLEAYSKGEKHHIADKVSYSQSYDYFPVAMYRCELNHKEDWTLKNWFFQIVVL